MDTIERRLFHHAEATPDRVFAISGRDCLTYGQIATLVARAAAWLEAEGIEPQSRVLLPVGSADLSFLVRYFAVHLAGAIAVPVDAKASAATRHAIERQIEECFEFSSSALDEATASSTGAGQPAPSRHGVVSLHSIADILFTSGTTGQSKGVALSHEAIRSAADNINAFVGNVADDREVITVPLHHSFGLGRIRCVVSAGGQLILVPGLTFPALAFSALEGHEATGLVCVPAGIAVLLQHDTARLARRSGRLRYMELGSSPMTPAAKWQLAKLLPETRLCMHYGLTEASRSAFTELHGDRQHLESVGRASPNVEIGIFDESDNRLDSGQTGRIKVRAASVMQGYWRNPSLTSSVLNADGWLNTGDIGRMDTTGYLYLEGRKDDLINVGGKKVHPTAIEAAVVQISGIKECACVGVADPDGILGQVPVLLVVKAPESGLDDSSIRAALRNSLDPHAMPREVRFVEALPKTSAGKVRRSELAGLL